MWGNDTSRRTINIPKFLKAFKEIKFKSYFTSKNKVYSNLVVALNASLISTILMIEAALLTCKELFGEEISCSFYEPPKMLRKEYLNYCWIEGSYTVITGSSDVSGPYIGVTSSLQTDDGSKYFHRYYQWVYLALIIQV